MKTKICKNKNCINKINCKIYWNWLYQSSTIKKEDCEEVKNYENCKEFEDEECGVSRHINS